MTPKEKAEELVEKMRHNLPDRFEKIAALIAVDEIMIEYKVLMIETAFCYDQFKYWEKVKQEIELL